MDSALVAPSAGVFFSSSLDIRTERARQFVDITEEVLELVQESNVMHGLAVVASQHTTAAVVVNEHEPELLKDLDRLLSELAPEAATYSHNDVPCELGQQPNGHAHCQALLLSSSASLPIVEGRPLLGRYQRIFLVELDCARRRRVAIAVVGV
jgi:secondary thiamine-phosphate synthase enzyme